MPTGPFGEPLPYENEEPSDEEELSDILNRIRSLLARDGMTEQDRLTFEKVTTLLQQVSATREKEQQAAMGGGPATNFLRRVTGGAV